MIKADHYGLFEEEDNQRVYMKVNGEEVQRKVSLGYGINVKKHQLYRNFTVVRNLLPTLEDDAKLHAKAALNDYLPLQVRRMHYDILGNYLEGEDKFTWANGGGIPA